MVAGLSQALDRVKSYKRNLAIRPYEHIAWTPGQLAFLSCPERIKLIRSGQQLAGKTTVLLTDLIYRCIGEHPYFELPYEPPIQTRLICSTADQSVVIQDKLYSLLPRDLVDWTKTQYLGPGQGFRGVRKTVYFLNGSRIEIRTSGQKGKGHASFTGHHIAIDEPTTLEVWTESLGRVRRTNGTISLGFTPINGPCWFYEEAVENGIIKDHHYKLSQANATPVGWDRPLCLGDGTPITDEWIGKLRETMNPAVAAVVLDGEWMGSSTDAYFGSVFTADPTLPGTHVRDTPPTGQCRVVLSTDWGWKPGKQTTLLMLLKIHSKDDIEIYVLDEYSPIEGRTSIEDDAKGIVAMLARNGIFWPEVDECWTDRPYRSGHGAEKSAKLLTRALSHQLGMHPDKNPTPVRTVVKPSDAIPYVCWWLYQQMAKPHGFGVHSRCERTIAALQAYDGTIKDCDAKDPCDAIRYAVMEHAYAYSSAAPARILSGSFPQFANLG